MRDLGGIGVHVHTIMEAATSFFFSIHLISFIGKFQFMKLMDDNDVSTISEPNILMNSEHKQGKSAILQLMSANMYIHFL